MNFPSNKKKNKKKKKILRQQLTPWTFCILALADDVFLLKERASEMKIYVIAIGQTKIIFPLHFQSICKWDKWNYYPANENVMIIEEN